VLPVFSGPSGRQSPVSWLNFSVSSLRDCLRRVRSAPSWHSLAHCTVGTIARECNFFHLIMIMIMIMIATIIIIIINIKPAEEEEEEEKEGLKSEGGAAHKLGAKVREK